MKLYDDCRVIHLIGIVMRHPGGGAAVSSNKAVKEYAGRERGAERFEDDEENTAVTSRWKICVDPRIGGNVPARGRD